MFEKMTFRVACSTAERAESCAEVAYELAGHTEGPAGEAFAEAAVLMEAAARLMKTAGATANLPVPTTMKAAA